MKYVQTIYTIIGMVDERAVKHWRVSWATVEGVDKNPPRSQGQSTITELPELDGREDRFIINGELANRFTSVREAARHILDEALTVPGVS